MAGRAGSPGRRQRVDRETWHSPCRRSSIPTTSTPPTALGWLAPAVRSDPNLVYVPNSESNTVDVIDQRTYKVIGHFATGPPQHVTPSYDLKTLWVDNDKGNSLTPIDP